MKCYLLRVSRDRSTLLVKIGEEDALMKLNFYLFCSILGFFLRFIIKIENKIYIYGS